MKWLLLLVPLMMAAHGCPGQQELSWVNHQYVWCRANTTADEESVTVIRGRILATKELNGQRLYFIEAACTNFVDWPDNTQCIESKITLSLKDGVEYDIVGWFEPSDRRTPDTPDPREAQPLRIAWMCCE